MKKQNDEQPAGAAPKRMRRKVESSNIAAVRWAPGTLEIEFRGGAVYRYPGVPEAEFRALMRAPSVGSHFAANIRARYKGEKVEG